MLLTWGSFNLPSHVRTIEITIGIVCACLPAINLMLEKQNAARVSQNRPRTRFFSSVVAMKSSIGSSVLKSIHATHTRRETGSAAGAGPSPWCTDEETGLHETRTGGRWVDRGKGDEIEVNQLLVGRCIRLNSKDGREEGWLRAAGSEPSGAGANAPPGGEDLTASARGGVTLQQLRQDPREILVPDRIWDGKRRSHEEPSPGDTPPSLETQAAMEVPSDPVVTGTSTTTKGGGSTHEPCVYVHL